MISNDVMQNERFPAFAVSQRSESTYFHAFFDIDDYDSNYVTNDLYYIQGQEEQTGISWAKPTLPENLDLSAYPNPFNSSTSIGFDLPKDSNITLAIFDILGRKVATLVDGHQAAGHHEVIWNASAYSSGVYFARARTDGDVKNIKLLYIK